jgi:hypothetical protein
MKLLTVGTRTYLTGDAIADAVIHYGVALANEHRVDLVDFPFVREDGVPSQVSLTVGLHIVLGAETCRTSGDELVDTAASNAITSRQRGLVPRGDTPFDMSDLSVVPWGDEW